MSLQGKSGQCILSLIFIGDDMPLSSYYLVLGDIRFPLKVDHRAELPGQLDVIFRGSVGG